MRHKKPENFLRAVAERGHGIAEARHLPMSEQASEALLMGLRLVEGIDLDVMARRFHWSKRDLIETDAFERYQNQGLVWHEGSRIGVSEMGRPLLDALLAEIIADALVETQGAPS